MLSELEVLAIVRIWSKDSASELQRRDARALFTESIDHAYMKKWAADLGVTELLHEITA